MRRTEQEALGRMRDCWFAGGTAFDLAPDTWRELAAPNDPPTREIVLLALAGQAFQVGHRPAPPTFVASVPLPDLALPAVPDAARQVFRATLKDFEQHGLAERLLGFVASRGFVAHPLDWMPKSATTDAPDIYAPWVDWIARREADHALPDDRLGAENWDAFFPAARRSELARMRIHDPAAARALLQEKAGGEPAETRLRLVQVMQTNLQRDDRPYLESLLTDRSGKVKSLAAHLLSRLGVSVGDDADKASAHAELADFIEAKRSLILRRRKLAPRALKTAAQERRRADLFELCTLRDLADRFETDEAGFVEAWTFGTEGSVDALLVALAARTASDAALPVMMKSMIAAGRDALAHTASLIARLSPTDGFSLQMAALKTLDSDMLDTFQAHAPSFSALDTQDLSALPIVKTLLKDGARTENASNRYRLERALRLVAFLARREAAGDLVDRLVAAGLSPTEPCLNPLRLNAALAAATSLP